MPVEILRAGRLLPALLIVLLTSCASQLYQRTALTLDIPDHDQLEVRYAEFDGCLLKQQIPVDYKVKRPRYTLRLETGFGTAQHAPSLSIELSGAPDAQVMFTGFAMQPDSSEADGVVRYRVDVTQAPGDHLSLEIRRGDDVLGNESIRVHPETCRAMSVGGSR